VLGFRLIPGFCLGDGLLDIAAKSLAATLGTKIGDDDYDGQLEGGLNNTTILNLVYMAGCSTGYLLLAMLIDSYRTYPQSFSLFRLAARCIRRPRRRGFSWGWGWSYSSYGSGSGSGSGSRSLCSCCTKPSCEGYADRLIARHDTDNVNDESNGGTISINAEERSHTVNSTRNSNLGGSGRDHFRSISKDIEVHQNLMCMEHGSIRAASLSFLAPNQDDHHDEGSYGPDRVGGGGGGGEECDGMDEDVLREKMRVEGWGCCSPAHQLVHGTSSSTTSTTSSTTSSSSVSVEYGHGHGRELDCLRLVRLKKEYPPAARKSWWGAACRAGKKKKKAIAASTGVSAADAAEAASSSSVRPKLAVRGLSFGIRRGECFGFLGLNGAGKTTTMKMLTGDLIASDGMATLSPMRAQRMNMDTSTSVNSGLGDQPLSHQQHHQAQPQHGTGWRGGGWRMSQRCPAKLSPTATVALGGEIDLIRDQARARREYGYCPQFDALIPLLTVTEQLQMYARIKLGFAVAGGGGITTLITGYSDGASSTSDGASSATSSAPGSSADAIAFMVSESIKRLDLAKHRHTLAGALSGGNKRKLSVAIALLGSPSLLFLDEPSTGMDPVARRFMWRVLAEYSAGGGSTMLTTHSMEECEALCQRVGILSAGQLICLGSISHLKAVFGKELMLEVTLKSLAAVAAAPPDAVKPPTSTSARGGGGAAAAAAAAGRAAAVGRAAAGGGPAGNEELGRMRELLLAAGLCTTSVSTDATTAQDAILGGSSSADANNRPHPWSDTFIAATDIAAACQCLGDTDRQHRISPSDPSGWLVWQQLQKQPGARILIEDFCNWWREDDRKEMMSEFVSTHFGQSARLVEQYGTRFTFKLSAKGMPLGHAFSLLEKYSNQLQIAEYSISQTTLEQIFTDFAKV
jgi:ABC-type multidrug transport system ATPase subunit